MIAAANIATRILGYVNAPSLIQLAVEKCLDEKANVYFYKRNRDTLADGLSKIGYTYVKLEGVFYL